MGKVTFAFWLLDPKLSRFSGGHQLMVATVWLGV
jgi:hypothetical protein